MGTQHITHEGRCLVQSLLEEILLIMCSIPTVIPRKEAGSNFGENRNGTLNIAQQIVSFPYLFRISFSLIKTLIFSHMNLMIRKFYRGTRF